MGLHVVQPPHPPPLPRILKIALNVKEKRYKKEKKYMKVRYRGGGYLLTYLWG